MRRDKVAASQAARARWLVALLRAGRGPKSLSYSLLATCDTALLCLKAKGSAIDFIWIATSQGRPMGRGVAQARGSSISRKPLVRGLYAVLEGNGMAPSEPVYPRNIQKFSRCPVGLRRVKHDIPCIANAPGYG